MVSLVVNNKYNNKKLNTFLLENFDGLNLNTIYKTLRKKDIRVNNVKVSQNIILKENDVVTIYLDDSILYKTFTITTIYEDDNILVVNKPIGIEVTSSDLKVKTIHSILQKQYSYIMPCHRLDLNTSGLVLFAKNEISLNILLDKFKKSEINKFYKCTVFGIPKVTSKTLVAYLFKDSKKSIVYISDTEKPGYKKIITSYKVLSVDKTSNTSVLEIELHTGRTHQIRAHLAHIGFPIIGDGKYGNYEINKKFKKRTQQLVSNKLIFNFSTNSQILDYLNGKIVSLDD